MTFILKKYLDIDLFQKYLIPAQESNQFSNYGNAVKMLEKRACEMLKIDDSKAVIATSSGSSAISGIIYAIDREAGEGSKIATQAFTFPSNVQGGAIGSLPVDFDVSLNIDVTNPHLIEYSDLVIVTNCFGHLQNIDLILQTLSDKNVVFDNAASPYSFWKGTNSCNLGIASYISLHHTKPIGFGEGGLIIIDKKYEKYARASINFGLMDDEPINDRGGNFKMSEVSAAAILQWWDQFNIDDLQQKYLDNYYNKRYEFGQVEGDLYPHRADEDDIFFPNCFPFIHQQPTTAANDDFERKYYKPVASQPITDALYDRIVCYGISPND